EEGKYIITASGAYRGYILGRGEARFSGTTVRKEYIDTTLNETLLEDVAGRSQGKYFTHVDRLDIDKLLGKAIGRARTTRREKTVNFNTPPVYLFIVLLLLIEWYMRRKRGLL
ncbi:MAG: hypothetical protein U9R36_01250, partial [Elusimicrobiota bacterium]|nr:hypothetical protein [Elusimicrobiota bacterium]